MKPFIVLYDACILYSAPLRDLFMHLALTDLFQAKWTNEIHNEWIRNVLANHSNIQASQLTKIRDLMNTYVLDCLIEDYEYLIPSLKLPDADDRHVLAAAIQSKASVIITYNLRDFPEKALRKYNITAEHPDHFLLQLIEFNADIVCTAIKKLRTGLKKPSLSVEQYLHVLEKQLLSKSVKKLENLSNLL